MTFHSFYRRRRNNCLLNCRVDRKAAKFYKTLNLLRALYNKIREEEGSRVETGKGMCHRRASAAHNMCSLKLACSLELLWGCPVLKIKFFGSTLVLHSNVSSSYLVFEQSQNLIRRRVVHQKPDFNFLKTTSSSMYFWTQLFVPKLFMRMWDYDLVIIENCCIIHYSDFFEKWVTPPRSLFGVCNCVGVLSCQWKKISAFFTLPLFGRVSTFTISREGDY